MTLLAVYGTLKRGHHNHEEHLDQDPIFADYVNLNAEMYTNGRYPMLIKSKEKNKIYIEIYDINKETLTAIDKLEEPFGYHREMYEFGNYERVWMYYYSSGNPPPEFRLVKTGNFVKEREW